MVNWGIIGLGRIANEFASGFNNLKNGLKKIGFNEKEVNGILGNNWYKFYSEIDK